MTQITETRVRELHQAAVVYAEEAARAGILGLAERARELWGYAMRREMEAADRCREEPSRSVLYRSAATLALDAGDQDGAARLAQFGLDGNPPPEIADELRAVLAKAGGK